MPESKEQIRKRNRAYYLKNREKILEQVKGYREANIDKVRANVSRRNKERWRELKAAALKRYGEECSCCGESEPDFLCIDHIGEDGAEKRKTESKVAFGTYGWLARNGYPDGYQTLCHNCNHSKHVNGGICTHKILDQKLRERSETIRKEYDSSESEARGTTLGQTYESITVVKI